MSRKRRLVSSQSLKNKPLSEEQIQNLFRLKTVEHELTPREAMEMYDLPSAKKRYAKKLIKNMGNYRGKETRGWSLMAPQRGRERQELYDQCGDSCFILGDMKKFPVCKKCHKGKCECALSCKGILSSKLRSLQWGYPYVYDVASRLYDEKCK